MTRIALFCYITVSLTGFGPVFASPAKEAKLWAPVEWQFDNPGYEGNPYDLVAAAVFTHKKTGRKIQTELFYDTSDTWKLRFTGTHTGR